MPMRSVLKATWRHLPLGVVMYSAFSLLHMECRSLQETGAGLVYTIVFPLFCIWLVLSRAWMEAGQSPVGAGLRAALFCLCAPLLVLLIPGLTCLQSRDTLKLVYEVPAALVLLALALHCLVQKGRWMFVLFFGACALYGIALESGGILMGFFQEEGYRVYLRPFLPGPLFVALGWSTVFYCTVYCTERITSKNTPVWARTVVAAMIALCFDLQLDPFATRCGWWQWNAALPAWHHEVPLINYISWICALLPFAWHYFHLSRRRREDKHRAQLALACVPVYLAVSGAFEVLVTLALCGPGSPSMHLFWKAMANPLVGR